MRRRVFLASLAAMLVLSGCRTCSNNAPVQISVFSNTIERLAKQRKISLDEAALLLKQAGVTGFDTNYNNPRLPELAQTALRPINLYGFLKFRSPDAGQEEIEKFIAAALKYQVPRIMVIPDPFSKDGDQESEYAEMRTGLKALVDQATKAGITVMIEDFGGVNNPCSYMRYLKAFLSDIPQLGFTIDSGNLHYAGRGEDIFEIMHFAKGRIHHLHLKDQEQENNRKYVTLGTGAVPNEAIVRQMRKSGYRNFYTLENLVGEDLLADLQRQVNTLRSWCE